MKQNLNVNTLLIFAFIVIDYHLDWCGPCEVIEPNYRAMFFAIEEADKRIEFLTVSNTYSKSVNLFDV